MMSSAWIYLLLIFLTPIFIFFHFNIMTLSVVFISYTQMVVKANPGN